MKFRKYLRFPVLLFLLGSNLLTASADKKIYLLSDIHVMDSSLVDRPDNKAWQEDLANNKKMQELSIPIFNQLVETIKEDKPDLLLIAGDLTKDGELVSHDYVIKKLTEIESAGIPVYVIPGNHDRGWQEGARQYKNNTYTSVKYMSENRFRNYYQPFGYGESSEVHEKTLSYAAEVLPGLTLIGIDSGQDAHVDDDALVWCCEKALEARNNGRQVLVMTHHTLIPHFYSQDFFHPMSVIDNQDELVEGLLDAGVKVALTGHYHVSDITRYTDSQGREIYDICTGTPLSYPCDYRILTFDDEFKTLKITTKSITTLEGYTDFPAYTKERMQTSVYHWASDWLTEHLEHQEVTDLMSQALSSVFVIHAEGNEPENPGSDAALLLYDSVVVISSLFMEDLTMLKSVRLSLRSILGDYPDENHQDDVVNDRELTITMPKVPTSIEHVTTSSETDAAWYTLQGLRLEGRPTRPGLYLRQGRKVLIGRR